MDEELRLEALEEENQRLRDEIFMLRDQLGMTFLAPLAFRLTGKETQIFGRLLKGGAVTKANLMNALYSDRPDDVPEIKIVDVFVCKLRAKLKRFSLDIETIWGVGYQMSPQMIAKFKTDWAHAMAA